MKKSISLKKYLWASYRIEIDEMILEQYMATYTGPIDSLSMLDHISTILYEHPWPYLQLMDEEEEKEFITKFQKDIKNQLTFICDSDIKNSN